MTTGPDNPLGAGFFSLFTNGALRQSFEVNPAVNGTSPLGTVVEALDYAGPGSSPRQAVPEIQPCALGADARMIGVITAGTDLKGDPGVEPGQAATVTCLGICQVLVDSTTVAGEALVLSTSTAGCAMTASSPTTRTIGLCLESVTVSSGTALAWAFVLPGSQGGSGGGGGTFPTFTGVGSPEGVVTGSAGQSYQATDTGNLYIQPGAGNTNWQLLGGAGDATVVGVSGDGAGGLDIVGLATIAMQSAGTVTMTANASLLMGLNGANGGTIQLNESAALEIIAPAGQGINIGIQNSGYFVLITPDGIATVPAHDSHTATTALGLPVVGTPLQNTLPYDVLFTACVHVATATAGQIVMGVAAGATPTTDPVSQPLSAAADVYVSGILPAGYFLLIDTLGTIVTSGSVETVYTPL